MVPSRTWRVSGVPVSVVVQWGWTDKRSCKRRLSGGYDIGKAAKEGATMAATMWRAAKGEGVGNVFLE